MVCWEWKKDIYHHYRTTKDLLHVCKDCESLPMVSPYPPCVSWCPCHYKYISNDPNCRLNLIWGPLLWQDKTVCLGWRKAIHWGQGLSKPWGGWGKGMIILNHHIHTCCTCDDAWGSHGCQLKCSDSDPSEPPLFMSKWFLKGWKKDIHNGTGLPKTCYGEINRNI